MLILNPSGLTTSIRFGTKRERHDVGRNSSGTASAATTRVDGEIVGVPGLASPSRITLAIVVACDPRISRYHDIGHRSRTSHIRPLAQRSFAEQHCASFPQAGDYKCIAWHDGAEESP